MVIKPVTLDGSHVRLEPLAPGHASGLWAASADPEIWRFMPFRIQSEDDARKYIRVVAKMREAGTCLPFAILAGPAREVAGSTGYWNIDRHNRRLEIGATWITPRLQRSAVNTEAKYLLLRHAFEKLGRIRVEFKADSLNEKSRAALARIGAQEEGILRNHMIQPDGRLRHSVYFSILDSEWPGVKARLEGFLSHA